MKNILTILSLILFASCNLLKTPSGLPAPTQNKSVDSILKVLSTTTTDTNFPDMPYTTGRLTQVARSGSATYDTVKVIILVCDTSSIVEGWYIDTKDIPKANMHLVKQNFGTYWQYGYAVREIHSEAEGDIDWYFDHHRPPGSILKHYKYLNEDKRELDKSIIVWQSKNIE